MTGLRGKKRKKATVATIPWREGKKEKPAGREMEKSLQSRHYEKKRGNARDLRFKEKRGGIGDDKDAVIKKEGNGSSLRPVKGETPISLK